MSKATVYVINYQDHDLESLVEFTDKPLVILTCGHVPINRATEHQIAEGLRGWKDGDYLVLSGSAALAALTVAVMKETWEIHAFNVLLYRRHTNDYVVNRIDGFLDDVH
jgi:hypothetical protein